MMSDDSEQDLEDSNSDGEEIEKYESEATRDIDNGKLVVNNRDGSYLCPFSPGKKKQRYKYREILAHATGVANGKKGPEKVGTHRALEKYLKAELGDGVLIPQAERTHQLEQGVPKRIARETKLLSPWMGILVNIDNSKRRKEDGFRLAAGAADIKEKFKEFNPQRVDVFHDFGGHQGLALLTFKNDIHGLGDAKAYDESFIMSQSGRTEWYKNGHNQSSRDLHGWQATEEDLEGGLRLLTEHLHKFSDLKTVADVVEEKERLNNQLVKSLTDAVGRKNDRLEACREDFVCLKNMVNEVDALRVKAEEDKKMMEEKHKQDLEEIQRNNRLNVELHNKKLLLHQVALTDKMMKLEQRCAEMKQAKTLIKQKNEADRLQFERERQEAQRQLEEVSKQAEKHAASQCKQRNEQKNMIKKHQGENKALEITVQEQKKKLAKKQDLELQTQRVAEMLEIEKGRKADKATITDLEDQQELLHSMVNDLILKERNSNDELEEARKVSLEILGKYGSLEKIGIKRAGSIDDKPWEAPCKVKYMYDKEGWDIKMKEHVSEWEELLRDRDYRPFRVVEVGPNKCEFRFDEDDVKLKQLKEDLGNEVWTSVTNAFLEMEQYNASGRYPVEVAWNFEKNQRVVLKDLLLYMKELLDGTKGKNKALKRQRGR